MADGVRYVPNRAFARSVLRSPAVAALCLSVGRGIQGDAASMYGATNYGLKVKYGARRVRAIVYTADRHAIRSNFRHNTLRKAAKRARG